MASWKDAFKQFPTSATQLAKVVKKPFIGRITLIEMLAPAKGEDEQPCIHLDSSEHIIRLNKTACRSIAKMHGDDMDKWEGKRVEISVVDTQFNGQDTKTIIVKPVSGK